MTLRGHTWSTRLHRRRSLERRAALWSLLGSLRRRPARSRPRPCGSSTRATIDVFLAGGDESHTGDREVFRDTLIWAKDQSSAGKAQGHCTVIDASTEILTIEPRPAQASPPPRWRAEATTAYRGQIQVDLDIARNQYEDAKAYLATAERHVHPSAGGIPLDGSGRDPCRPADIGRTPTGVLGVHHTRELVRGLLKFPVSPRCLFFAASARCRQSVCSRAHRPWS